MLCPYRTNTTNSSTLTHPVKKFIFWKSECSAALLHCSARSRGHVSGAIGSRHAQQIRASLAGNALRIVAKRTRYARHLRRCGSECRRVGLVNVEWRSAGRSRVRLQRSVRGRLGAVDFQKDRGDMTIVAKQCRNPGASPRLGSCVTIVTNMRAEPARNGLVVPG